MNLYQGVYFFAITLSSFLLALTLGHLSRWFPTFGLVMQTIVTVIAVCAFVFCLLKRDNELTAACFFCGFILAFAGGMAWL